MESHSLVRTLGIIATVFSVYRAFTSSIPLDDLIALLSISLAIVWLGNEMEKNSLKKEGNCQQEAMPRGFMEIIKIKPA